MDSSNTLNNLRHQIKYNLPGKDAQLKMLPYVRELKPLGSHIETKESAVLILLWIDHSCKICIIKRNSKMRNHAGQYALPGGKFDPLEDTTLEETALRETFEEVGVSLSRKQMIGSLSRIYIPVSAFYITPYIAFIGHQHPSFNANPDEVEEVVEIPLETLFNSKGSMEVDIKGKKVTVPCYNYNETKIWGATAMILSELEAIWHSINKTKG
ncbi:CoA pyrophosphatase [Halosquirtibacter laminarini]|uniref:CoA pyrophosphatase n=1 Tax=Halosquirtibacter laminarini TaxID=3374600 RepID=A0AC61NNP1_9BACT|nr:CoA pyrophosphatase [Prolixibacteraceae bacterium]